MSFEKEQDSIRKKVEQLCITHPEAKKDYRTLLQYYWYYVDGLKQYVPREVLGKLSQPESITRAFRKAVEEGTIMLTREDKQQRQDKEKDFHRYYGQKRLM